jgi:hypothetical protein
MRTKTDARAAGDWGLQLQVKNLRASSVLDKIQAIVVPAVKIFPTIWHIVCCSTTVT